MLEDVLHRLAVGKYAGGLGLSGGIPRGSGGALFSSLALVGV